MRGRTVAALVVLCAALTSCDNFLEVKVLNPCPFQINVAFASIRRPPPVGSWPYQVIAPARSEVSYVTGAPGGGPFPYTERVQVSAGGRTALVTTIAIPADNLDWSIPDSFCG